MPITHDQATGECRYVQDFATVKRKTDDILFLFSDFVGSVEKTGEWDSEAIKINHDRVTMMAQRIEKRKEYYKMFHDGSKISEPRYFGLLIYWTLRLQPCFVETGKPTDKENSIGINESFAYWLFVTIMNRLGAVRNVPYLPSEDLKKRIKYAFTYWDLSKESMMLMMDLLDGQLLNFEDILNSRKNDEARAKE